MPIAAGGSRDGHMEQRRQRQSGSRVAMRADCPPTAPISNHHWPRTSLCSYPVLVMIGTGAAVAAN